jgi:hypothetical protein
MIKKLLIVLCMFALATGAGAQTKGKSKPKTDPKAKTKPAPGDSTATEEPVDPMEALEATLPLEVELDPMTGKKVVHKDVKRRNDSLRADLRARIKK